MPTTVLMVEDPGGELVPFRYYPDATLPADPPVRRMGVLKLVFIVLVLLAIAVLMSRWLG